MDHVHSMLEFLAVDKPEPMNGYQLRAVARGQPLPKRGPEALDPFRALVHANRALAFLRLDAYDRALDDAAESCRLLPQYLKAWVRRAAALAATNHREDALSVLDEALGKACPDEASKEQVCKLIVRIRALGSVEVRPPERDVPPVPRRRKKTAKGAAAMEAVKVPLGLLRPAREDDPEGGEARQAFAEVDKRDLDAFLREDWHATHLGGRWRQTRDEVEVVIALPRRPKASELLVQIRPQRLWILLRRPGVTGSGGKEDYETLCDEAFAGTVRPSESTWVLEAEGAAEIHFSLQKQLESCDAEALDGVTRHLWDRALEGDAPIDVASTTCAAAEKAERARAQVLAELKAAQPEAREVQEVR